MMRLLKRLRHLAATAVSFSLFGFWGTWLAWVDLPRIHRRTPGTPKEKALACRKRVSASFQFLFRFMCRVRLFDLSDTPSSADLPQDGRFVLIANHPSLVDMVALFSCFPEVAIVARDYMFNSPMLGPLLRRCQFIDGGGGDAFSGASVIAAGIQRLEQGIPVLIFPEGTRSPIRGFGKFRRGAFEMACRAGVPVLPAYITNAPRTLMKGMHWYRLPVDCVKIRISLGAPISPLPDENSRDMMKRVEAVYEERLKELGMISPESGPAEEGSTPKELPASQPADAVPPGGRDEASEPQNCTSVQTDSENAGTPS